MDVLWKESNIFYNVLCVLITENEKLFDRSDARLYWRTVYHMMVIFHHVYVANFASSINLNSDFEEIRILKTFRMAYLTGWNFSFQTTFLCLALTYDVLQWFDKEGSKFGQRIRYFRDIVFNGLVFPFTCFVHFMFWAIYFINRELVFPVVYDQILPWWLNHCVHTNIIIVIIIETILTSRRYPTDVNVERFFYIFINVFYCVVFYSIYFFAGCWLYGVFGVMNWWQICLYQSVISLSSYIFYHSAFFFNRLIHGPEDVEQITKMTNGDVESKTAIQFDADLKNGDEMKIACVENILIGDAPKPLKDNFVVENGSNGEQANGEKLNGDCKINENGHHNDNGKDWRSIEEKGDGIENGTFEKSWSAKYRTSRNQFENSSL